jgi:hypothetical protein
MERSINMRCIGPDIFPAVMTIVRISLDAEHPIFKIEFLATGL